MTFYTRLQVREFIGGLRMLQVIKRAAVGDGGNQRAELQWGHRDALAERAHFPYATQLSRNNFFRINSQVFTRDVITGQLAQSELMRVVADLLEAQAPTDSFEVGVVGMRQRHCQIHLAAAAEGNWGLFCNQVLTERGQSYR